MKRKILSAVFNLALVAVLITGCAPESEAPKPGDIVEVARGDIKITVNSDGHLEMPYQYDLKFGTQGAVDQIYIEEGDSVREGALLAMLDSSAQVNSVMTALLSVQTAKNNISLGCGIDHLPYNYPNLAVPRMMEEAQDDINKAVIFFSQGNYKDAGYWLIMTYFDVLVCEDLIANTPDAAELAGAQSNSTYLPDIDAGSLVPSSERNQAVIEYLRKYRYKLIAISNRLKDETIPYANIEPDFAAVQQEILQVISKANSTIPIKNRMTFYYTDTATSADFLQASLRYLQELEQYLESDNATAAEAAEKLYTAKLNLLVGRDVLANDTNIFESGGSINWKTLQQYNLSLQNAEINLYRAKQEIMKTAIIAPKDGVAVSVDLKKSSVLSAQDYSSRTAVSLVDTGKVRFKGTIDEIDISKVQRGQAVTLQVDAVPGHNFTGRVRFISPYGDTSGSVIKFPVLIDIDDDGTEIRGGLTATSEILVTESKNTLLVPANAVTTINGKSMVMVVLDKEEAVPEMREVTTGLENWEYTEITSGLQEGEKVKIMSDELAIPTSVSSSLRTMRQ